MDNNEDTLHRTIHIPLRDTYYAGLGKYKIPPHVMIRAIQAHGIDNEKVVSTHWVGYNTKVKEGYIMLEVCYKR